MFEGIPIRSRRLILRPYREADAEALFAIFSDRKVMRFMSTPPWTSIDKAREVIARAIAASGSGEYLTLGIERSDEPGIIGQCVLFKISDTCRRAELGYCLASRAWGNGYMNEALHALLRYAFERLNLNRIEADIDPRNERSARSLERLGFVREGVLRERWIVDGEVSDTALYGLLRKDWRSRQT